MPQPLIDYLARAATFYRDQLLNSPHAIAYLKSRGVRGDTAARFRLGYAPAGFQALRASFPDYGDPALQAAGLVATNDAGRRYDRFRDRVMFPILDDAGDVIGFGGRVLAGDGPKYLNSPETPVFQKGRVLFGLTQAADAIAATSTVFVVEGEKDADRLTALGLVATTNIEGAAQPAQRVFPQHRHKLSERRGRGARSFPGRQAGRGHLHPRPAGAAPGDQGGAGKEGLDGGVHRRRQRRDRGDLGDDAARDPDHHPRLSQGGPRPRLGAARRRHAPTSCTHQSLPPASWCQPSPRPRPAGAMMTRRVSGTSSQYFNTVRSLSAPS